MCERSDRIDAGRYNPRQQEEPNACSRPERIQRQRDERIDAGRRLDVERKAMAKRTRKT